MSENKKEKDYSFKKNIYQFIGKYKDAPSYSVDNKYIETGYRVNFQSKKSVFKSMFMLHNETTNIWTHFIGFLLIIVLMLYVAKSYEFVDVKNFKNRVSQEIYSQLEPFYEDFKNLDKGLNEHICLGITKYNEFHKNAHQQFSQVMFELQKHKEENLDNFVIAAKQLPDQLQSYVEQVNSLRNCELNLQLPDQLQSYMEQVNSLRNCELNLDFSFIVELKDSIHKSILEMEENIKEDFAGFKERALNKIDSDQYDYVDIIAYFNMHDTMPASNHEVSRWPIIIFLMSAAFCLFCSFFFHLVYCISYKVQKVFLRLDYAGVCILISGSVIPLCYYSFYCQLQYAQFHITFTTVCSTVVFIVTLQDFIHQKENLALKSTMFAALGIGAAIPIAHLALYEGFFKDPTDLFSTAPSVIYYLLAGASYLSGLYMYTQRFPECMRPGQFDLCGASHQIWHISVLIGILCTYIGTLINFHNRVSNQCPII